MCVSVYLSCNHVTCYPEKITRLLVAVRRKTPKSRFYQRRLTWSRTIFLKPSPGYVFDKNDFFFNFFKKTISLMISMYDVRLFEKILSVVRVYVRLVWYFKTQCSIAAKVYEERSSVELLTIDDDLIADMCTKSLPTPSGRTRATQQVHSRPERILKRITRENHKWLSLASGLITIIIIPMCVPTTLRPN